MAAVEPDIVVSALVLRDADGRVLCVRKRGTTRFMLPGGKPEAGETRLETALRETAEELGVELAPSGAEPLGEWLSEAANEPGHVLHSTVFAATTPIVETPEPAAEIAEAQWLTLDEIESRDDIAPMLSGNVAPALRARGAADGAPARAGDDLTDANAEPTPIRHTAVPGAYRGRLVFRYLVFALGMFVMALGIALTVRADLGTTPISTPPYVVSLGGGVTLGVATIIMHVVFVAAQIALLRRDFEWIQLLQIGVGVGFGVLIDAAMWLTSWFQPEDYWLKWIGVLAGSAVLALGVTLQFLPKVLMNAGEGTVAALARVTGLKIGTMKILFDATLVGIGVLISLGMFGRIEGVREGTLAATILVGFIVGRLMPPMTRWFAGCMHQRPAPTPPEVAPEMSA